MPEKNSNSGEGRAFGERGVGGGAKSSECPKRKVRGTMTTTEGKVKKKRDRPFRDGGT